MIYLTESSAKSYWVQHELDTAFIKQANSGKTILALFVQSDNVRKQLPTDIQAIHSPVFNNDNYPRSLGQLITRAWESYLQRVIQDSIVKSSNEIKRLRNEIEVLTSRTNNIKYFHHWCETNTEFTSKYGFTDGSQSLEKVWEQFFEKGRIILSTTNDWTLVIYGEQRTFKRLGNPEAIITGGPYNETMNETYLNELLQKVAVNRDIYQELSLTKQLVGGIGTIYIRDEMYNYLGKPLGAEFSSGEILRVQGNGAELLVGEPHQNGSPFKAVFLLEEEGNKFSKFECQRL